MFINIEIQKRNRLKEFFQKLFNRIEDMMFSIILKIPEKIIPQSLLDWFDRYTTKRINQLKQQNIKQNWNNTYLENALDEISNSSQND